MDSDNAPCAPAMDRDEHGRSRLQRICVRLRVHRPGVTARRAGSVVVNAVSQAPGTRRLAKLAGGIDKQRPLPKFAPLTLQQWFAEQGGSKNPNGPRVVVFPDTFNNHLHTRRTPCRDRRSPIFASPMRHLGRRWSSSKETSSSRRLCYGKYKLAGAGAVVAAGLGAVIGRAGR